MDLTVKEIPIAPESNSLWINARRAEELENSSRFTLFGEASRADLARFKRIVRLISTLDGKTPLSEGRLDKALDPSGFEKLQLVVGAQFANKRANRRDYSL